MSQKGMIRLFGIPMDLGQNRRGVDMGPSAVRYAGLQEQLEALGYSVCDEGNTATPQAEETTTHYHAEIEGQAHFLPEVTAVCQATYDTIRKNLGEYEYGIFIGGDHSMSIGTVAAAARDRTVGVLWIDAHTDMNTAETSPSGNIHGMSLAVLLGYGPTPLVNVGYAGPKMKAEHVALVGVRSIDLTERPLVKSSAVTVHTMHDVDTHGMSRIASEIIGQFADCDAIHVSLDLDSCDPRHAPGVGTPVMGGLAYREIHLLLEMLSETRKVRTVDIVEINPILDNQNQTGKIAVEFVSSLFGKRIL